MNETRNNFQCCSSGLHGQSFVVSHRETTSTAAALSPWSTNELCMPGMLVGHTHAPAHSSAKLQAASRCNYHRHCSRCRLLPLNGHMKLADASKTPTAQQRQSCRGSRWTRRRTGGAIFRDAIFSILPICSISQTISYGTRMRKFGRGLVPTEKLKKIKF